VPSCIEIGGEVRQAGEFAGSLEYPDSTVSDRRTFGTPSAA
jgi:hypothetical protein